MPTTTSTMQQVGTGPLLETPRAVAVVAVARTSSTKERTSSPSRKQLNILAPPLSPTSSSRHTRSHIYSKCSGSSPTSPRLSKKMQRLEAAQASKQERQAGRNRALFGLLVAFYLLIALCFCLPFFKDPSKARHRMTEALVAELKQRGQMRFAPHQQQQQQQQHALNAQVRVQQQQQQQQPDESPVSTTFITTATTVSTTTTTCPQQQQQCGKPQLQQHCMQQQQQQPNPFAQPATSATATREQVTFEHGKVGEVPYHRCSLDHQNYQSKSNNNSHQSSRDMVILNGKSFFPELPVAGSGISLEQNMQEQLNARAQVMWKLCNQASREQLLDSITVVSLDGSEEVAQLTETLHSLWQSGKVAQLPVAALVTPGASASLLMDWILYGDWTTLQERVARHWIPVSAGAPMLQALGMEDDIDDDYDKYYKGSHVMDDSVTPVAAHHHPLRVIDDWPTLALHCATGDELSVRAARILQRQTHHSQMRSVPGSGVDCFMDRSGDGAAVLLDYLRPQLPAAQM